MQEGLKATGESESGIPRNENQVNVYVHTQFTPTQVESLNFSTTQLHSTSTEATAKNESAMSLNEIKFDHTRFVKTFTKATGKFKASLSCQPLKIKSTTHTSIRI